MRTDRICTVFPYWGGGEVVSHFPLCQMRDNTMKNGRRLWKRGDPLWRKGRPPCEKWETNWTPAYTQPSVNRQTPMKTWPSPMFPMQSVITVQYGAISQFLCPCVVYIRTPGSLWCTNYLLYTVADSGFSPGGCANCQKCYYVSNICRKLHENERIWTPRGGGGARPWRHPLDPPMVYTPYSHQTYPA